MSTLYPYPVQSFTTPSEKTIWELMQKRLGDNYVVFYGARWNRVKKGDIPNIECDFIVAKKDVGIVIIEVKGGMWERIGGYWRANGKSLTESESPFVQAIRNKTALIELLRVPESWKGAWIPVIHAVALPQTPHFDQSVVSGLPPVLFEEDLPYFEEWIEDVMEDCRRQNNPNTLSPRVLQHLTETLMRDYTVSLDSILKTSEKNLQILTQQQLELDRSLSRQKHLVVQGCAGSGKTLMAVKQVRRLLQKPGIKRILFTCYNYELSFWLQEQTNDIRQYCTTIAFQKFCEEKALEAGLITGKEAKNKVYFNSLPYMLPNAADELDLKFDAIVVDEGQSFHTDWWIVLKHLLAAGQESHFYVFYDELQRIYSEKENTIPDEDRAIDLTVNVRNTAKIHRQSIKFLPPDRLPDCNGVDGEPVQIYTYNDESEMKGHLRNIFEHVIVKGRVSSKDVIVLTANGDKTDIRDGEKYGAFTMSSLETANAEQIRYTSIQGFRGMERSVVILTEFEKSEKSKELLNYLGCSRAKSLLIMLLSKGIDSEFLAQMIAGCDLKN